MPALPAFLAPRPAMTRDSATLAAFDALFEACVAEGIETPPDYALPAPKWQFLSHIVETREVLLHGSGNPGITRFEPRQPNDTTEFGNQRAVYAAGDGIWPLFYAILDRDRYRIGMINSAVRLVEADGTLGPHGYFFSITDAALRQRPYRRGWIYVLPRSGFVCQPPTQVRGISAVVPQWASAQPVTPLFRIEVGPEDFPLLDALRGHDDERAFARTRAEPDGFPWLDE